MEMTASRTSRPANRVVFQEMIRAPGCVGYIVLHPSSPKRVVWDLFSLLIVSYDVMTLPLMAFRYDEMKIAETLRMVTTIFWTMDIMVTFFTGYHDGGVVEGYPRKIAMRYITRTFFLDALIVAVDWAMLSASVNSESRSAVDVARLGKVLRGFRLLRILRLLRVVKFVDVSRRLKDTLLNLSTQTRALFQMMGILRLMAIVIVANHFLACAWFAIGEAQDPEDSWLRQLDPDDNRMIYAYAVSYHWSIAQFTPAPNNFHPQTMEERWFAIAVLLFGFTMFSSFLGSITSLLTHIRNSAVKRTEEDVKVREFLSQNNVSLQLGNRVITYLRQKQVQSNSRVLEKDVYVLADLPSTLKAELRFEVYEGVFFMHPFMVEVLDKQQPFVLDLCDGVMSQRVVAKGHELFNAHAACSSVFVTLTDGLHYKCTKAAGLPCEEPLPADMWLAEAALWMPWTHSGRAWAKAPSTVAVLNCEGFRKVALKHPGALELCQQYARLYSKHFVEMPPDERLDTSLPNEVTTRLTEHALQLLRPSSLVDSAPEVDEAAESTPGLSTRSTMLLAQATLAFRRRKLASTMGGQPPVAGHKTSSDPTEDLVEEIKS